ncbi:MAG TPA: nuclear transport factor 2 family protein [Dehalococcoidia bacterium]|nr:nuclear transport factor 2 family protein [Dehalococcoidia bacterium]
MLTVEAEHLQLVNNVIRAIATRNREALEDCLTQDVVLHVPGTTLVSGTFKGREEVLEALGHFAQMGGPSLSIRLHDVLANERHGIVMYDVSAEREGKAISYRHIDIYHFRDGRIRDVTGCPYDLNAFEELYG